jgi:hypothetical protein
MHGRFAGCSAVALAIAFNLPYVMLALQFDYPGILRKPPGDILAAFAAGGPRLVLTWYAFYLCALAMVPLAPSLAFAQPAWVRSPTATVGAAITGALAGAVQAIGLARWIFAVPAMARQRADPGISEAGRVALETSFESLNLWAGVAIGEHTGQLLTCLWIAFALMHRSAEYGGLAIVARASGLIAILGIGFGTGEGLAIALNVPGELFSIATISGYLSLSIWLMASGVLLVVTRRTVSS